MDNKTVTFLQNVQSFFFDYHTLHHLNHSDLLLDC